MIFLYFLFEDKIADLGSQGEIFEQIFIRQTNGKSNIGILHFFSVHDLFGNIAEQESSWLNGLIKIGETKSFCLFILELD